MPGEIILPESEEPTRLQKLVAGAYVVKMVLGYELPELAKSALKQDQRRHDEPLSDYMQRRSREIKDSSERVQDAITLAMGLHGESNN